MERFPKRKVNQNGGIKHMKEMNEVEKELFHNVLAEIGIWIATVFSGVSTHQNELTEEAKDEICIASGKVVKAVADFKKVL